MKIEKFWEFFVNVAASAVLLVLGLLVVGAELDVVRYTASPTKTLGVMWVSALFWAMFAAVGWVEVLWRRRQELISTAVVFSVLAGVCAMGIYVQPLNSFARWANTVLGFLFLVASLWAVREMWLKSPGIPTAQN